MIIKAEGGRGVFAMSNIINKYNSKAFLDIDGKKDAVLDAFYHSFRTYV